MAWWWGEFPYSTKTWEVLENPSLTPKRFPKTQEISRVQGKSRGSCWWSTYTMSNHHPGERRWWLIKQCTLMVILVQNQYLGFLQQFQHRESEKFNDQTMLGPVAFDWEWERKAHCSKTRNWFSTFSTWCIDWLLFDWPTHNKIHNGEVIWIYSTSI